ncbi:MAG: sensor histidine kinase [Firmicutes bacterium HGW-Firmicutes-16]|nr:MAG: sensor histidine kinase [Firmicutes bacterium HGW-Firmicutes-16]
MNKLTHSLLAKIIAIFLIFLIALSTVGMGCVVGAMTYLGGYEKTEAAIREEQVESKLYGEASGVGAQVYEGIDISAVCKADHLYYTVKNEAEEVVATNYDGQKLPYSVVTSLCPGDYFEDVNPSSNEYYNVSVFTTSLQNAFDLNVTANQIAKEYYEGKLDGSSYADSKIYYQIQDNAGLLLAANYDINTTLDYYDGLSERISTDQFAMEEAIPEEKQVTYTVELYADDEYVAQQTDGLQLKLSLIHLAYTWRYAAIVFAVLGLILFFALLVFLYCAAGHRKGIAKAVLNPFDKIPFDLLIGIIIGFIAIEVLFVDGNSFEDFETIIIAAVYMLVDFLLFLLCTMSFATRVKVGKWWRNTIIFYVLCFCCRIICKLFHGIRYVCRNLPLIWKTCLILIALVFANFIAAMFSENGGVVAFWLIETIIVVPAVLISVINLRKLQKAGELLSKGDFEKKVDTSKMFWDFKKHGENLNSVGTGMAIAVDQRMKSERLKTELITNVSHDIKTPLTSIINYVDLLQKPHTEEQEVEYIEVLDRQSKRLKKLTEDLVEASKASTGNMSVVLVPTSVQEIVQQSVGEYAERLAAGKIEPVVTIENPEMSVMADGRLLWRVLDNLLNNVCKYAQSGTRVYINARTEENRVAISVKNISKDPLNISAVELMERFVRGDSSRSTEGSGLGLNIARSLVELQKGSFSLSVDGDLFKAEIRMIRE